MTILETGITNVFFETKIEDSQMDRMNVMDIDANMKLSFMAGMVEVRMWLEILLFIKSTFRLNFDAQNTRYLDLQNTWVTRSFLMIG